MRRITPAAVLLAASALAAPLASPAGADEVPPAEPAAPADGTLSYQAEPGSASIADMAKFADEIYEARFDFSRAAKVENLVIQRDTAKWTLDGWVFLKGPARGISSQAMFFGKGRFEMDAPVPIERQQIRRFLGTDRVDVPVEQVAFTFTGADDQARFEGLSYSEAEAAAAFAESPRAKKWSEDVGRIYEKGLEPLDDARRRHQQLEIARHLYDRILDPAEQGSLETGMWLDLPEGLDTSRSHLVELSWSHEPDALEEITLAGRFDHGKEKPWSLIAQFSTSDQYQGGQLEFATSDHLERELKEPVGMTFAKMVMTFDPNGKNDMHMRSDMEIVVQDPKVRMVDFQITPLVGAKRAWLDGKEIPLHHPAVPGAEYLHAPWITVALPRAYTKGETLRMALELEGDVLYNVDGSTWMVKEEDVWFPDPSPDLGGTSTRFDTTLIVPKGLVAVANGAESTCEPGVAGADRDCFRFVTNTGIDFATFNISREFKIDRGKALDGTPIGVYTNRNAKREFTYRDPDNPALVQRRSYSMSETGPAIVEKARLAHATYEDWFGDSPYDSLWLTPHEKGHGRGSASLLLLYQGAFLSTTNQVDWGSITGNPPTPWSSDAFIAHEIAHQWWGGAAGIRGRRDQWFSEGFANYGSVLVLEQYDKVNKTQWMRGELESWKRHLFQDDGYINGVSPLALGTRVNSPENRRRYQGAYSWYIYDKGGWVMHMLRTLSRAVKGDPAQGDAHFKQAVRAFIDEYRGKRAPTNLQLVRSLGRSYGDQALIDQFFRQWVYGLGIPKVEFSHEIVQGDGGWKLRGRFKQADTAFTFPVAVALHQKGQKGDPAFFYQWVRKQDDTFEVGPIPFRPDKVTVNDDMGLLAEIREVPWSGAAAGQ